MFIIWVKPFLYCISCKWNNFICILNIFWLKVVCVHSSYGSVFKAIHKESGQVVAIKQVPVESDLQEIIKEISIMQQCDRFRHYTDKLLCILYSLHHTSLILIWVINSSTLQRCHMLNLTGTLAMAAHLYFLLRRKLSFNRHCVCYLFVAPMLWSTTAVISRTRTCGLSWSIVEPVLCLTSLGCATRRCVCA